MARHRHRSSKHRHSSKNFINKTIDQSVSVVKSTSKKYMPKVKTGLENVGSKVVRTGQKSVPFLQQLTRKFFGMFSKRSKTRRNRKH
jgi:hypothetical protein